VNHALIITVAWSVLCSESKRALLYNDISVLENHHASTTFTILRDPQCNILQKYPKQNVTALRSSIIEAVLATDMVPSHMGDTE